MRFRSELLQPPPSNDSEAILTKIYDVYRSPDGHIAEDEEDEETSSTKAAFPQND
jgi:hypothetical protein